MQTKLLHIVLTVSLLVMTGCSSSDDDSSNNSNSAENTSGESSSAGDSENMSGANNSNDGGNAGNQFFFGGTSCGSSGSGVVTGSTTAADDTNSEIENGSDTAMQTDNDVGDEVDIDCSAALDRELPGPGVADTGEGSLSFDEKNITLSAATIEDDGFNFNNTVSFVLWLHDGDTRSAVQSNTVVNGNETITDTRVDWGIYNASIGFMVELNQAETSEFTGGSFDVISIADSPNEITFDYATFSFLLEDKDGNLFISDFSEMVQVTSGNINVTGAEPDWSVTLDVTLDDGRTVTGVYDGSFHALPFE